MFGGKDTLHRVVADATKEKDIFKKSLLSQKTIKKSRVSNYGKAGTSGSRNRSRSRSPPRKTREEYKRKPRNYGNGSKFSRGKNASKNDNLDYSEDEEEEKPKRKKAARTSGKKKKGEFLSPSSFAEAWQRFFTPASIMLVTIFLTNKFFL